MEDYVKTGEDKKFEYYRNDSEVVSGDGEEEQYMEILNKRDEFNVKILDKDITIKKRTLNRIMILSDSQPEEQVLFSLYKTVKNKHSQDKIRTNPIANENIKKNNPSNFDSLRDSKVVSFPNMASKNNDNNNLNDNKNQITLDINNPLSEQTNVITNNNLNSNKNNNTDEYVINIPSNEGSDNEENTFKKNENVDDILLVGLPPQALRAKWFYLLLTLVGIGYIILFIVGVAKETVGFMFNIFCTCIIGIFLMITGIFGFIKINNRIYDNTILQIFTIICPLLGIFGAIIIVLNVITKSFFAVALIFGIFDILFSILCLFWTWQLKKGEYDHKQKQLELLVDDKK